MPARDLSPELMYDFARAVILGRESCEAIRTNEFNLVDFSRGGRKPRPFLDGLWTPAAGNRIEQR